MATSLTDNFSYQGALPNFARDSFDSLEAMRDYPEYCLDDGHLSFCAEDRNTYRFDRRNDGDPVTGKWRIFGGTLAVEKDLVEDLVIPANPSKSMETVYYITVKDYAYSIGAEAEVKWIDGVAPVTRTGKTYVISVLNNYAVWGEF